MRCEAASLRCRLGEAQCLVLLCSQSWSEQVFSTKLALAGSATMLQGLQDTLTRTFTACFVPGIDIQLPCPTPANGLPSEVNDDHEEEEEDKEGMADRAEVLMAAAQAELLPEMLTMWRSLPSVIVREYGIGALRKSLNACLQQYVPARRLSKTACGLSLPCRIVASVATDDFETSVLPVLLARTQQLYAATVLPMLPAGARRAQRVACVLTSWAGMSIQSWPPR